jgi:hypothetical protein
VGTIDGEDRGLAHLGPEHPVSHAVLAEGNALEGERAAGVRGGGLHGVTARRPFQGHRRKLERVARGQVDHGAGHRAGRRSIGAEGGDEDRQNDQELGEELHARGGDDGASCKKVRPGDYANLNDS